MRNVLTLAVMLACLTPIYSNAQNASASALANDLYRNPQTPFSGNPNADVTIVEFYDYQCGYCKASEEGLERLSREDGNLKIVYKDFPKLGPLSATASIATLAAMRQGMDKYLKWHDMLMAKGGRHSSEPMLYQTAGAAGIDIDRLKQDMKDAAIAQQIQDSIAIAKSIGVRMTPTFVVNGQVYPGYATYDQLKERVDYARAGGGGR